MRELTDAGIVVVTSTRVAAGPVAAIYGDGGGVDLLAAGTVPSGLLRPSQARMLLAALLGLHRDPDAVRVAFAEHAPTDRTRRALAGPSRTWDRAGGGVAKGRDMPGTAADGRPDRPGHRWHRRYRQGDRHGSRRPGRAVAITGRDRSRAEDAAGGDPGGRRTAGRGVRGRTCPRRRGCAGSRRRCSTALPRLDVLVNNVGGFWNTRHVTADGLERTFALNHLAPFLLTHLLVDRLGGERALPAWSRCPPTHSGSGGSTSSTSRANGAGPAQRAYNQSKLANVLFTYELPRRLRGTGVTATVLHPGIVRTDSASRTPAASSGSSPPS